MKDFKFTKEERDSIEDFALDQVIERNFGGIENVTDYIESLIQSRADADGCAAKDAEIAELKLRIECIETKFASASKINLKNLKI